MSRAVEIYVTTLKRLTAARRFRSFVHPVAPVLGPTRPTVKVFNATLRARVSAEPSLTWLDFADGTATPLDRAPHTPAHSPTPRPRTGFPAANG